MDNEQDFQKEVQALPPLSSTLIKAIKKEKGEGDKETYCFIQERIIEKADCSFYQVEIVPLVQVTSYINMPKSLIRFNKLIDSEDNKFQVTINKNTIICKIGPYNNLSLNSNDVPRGSGIGTYAFGHLIDMLKVAGYGDYETSEEILTSSDAKKDSGINGPRRDKFYTNLGFTIIVDGNDAGKILPEKIDNLWNYICVKDRNKEKITVIDIGDFIREKIIHETNLESKIDKLERTNKNIDESLAEKRDKKSPKNIIINCSAILVAFMLGLIICYGLIQLGTYLGIYR